MLLFQRSIDDSFFVVCRLALFKSIAKGTKSEFAFRVIESTSMDGPIHEMNSSSIFAWNSSTWVALIAKVLNRNRCNEVRSSLFLQNTRNEPGKTL